MKFDRHIKKIKHIQFNDYIFKIYIQVNFFSENSFEPPNQHKKILKEFFFNYIKIKIYIILIYKVVYWPIQVGCGLYPNSTRFWQVVEQRTCHQL